MLTYLFRVYFADGDTYEQAPEDVAQHADRGSAFTDVLYLEREQSKQIAVFALCNGDGVPVAAVHLTDGHFEVSGSEFWAGTKGLAEDVTRRLIYYRLVTHERSMDIDTATGEELSGWRETTHTRYVIGWQATIDGRNVQHVIALDE